MRHDLSSQLGRRAVEAWMRGSQRGLAQATASADGVGHVYALSPVGAFFGEQACTALSFASDLQAVQGCRSVMVHVSSPGGDCEEGFAVANMLVEFGRTHDTCTIVESCAAGVASVIALASNRAVMAGPEAEMMIHQAWGVAVGNADDLVARAERLRQLNESMVTFYARHTGQAEDAVRALMANGDRYMKAPECMELGFADGVLGAEVERQDPRISGPAGWFCRHDDRPSLTWATSHPDRTVRSGVREFIALCLFDLSGSGETCRGLGQPRSIVRFVRGANTLVEPLVGYLIAGATGVLEPPRPRGGIGVELGHVRLHVEERGVVEHVHSRNSKDVPFTAEQHHGGHADRVRTARGAGREDPVLSRVAVRHDARAPAPLANARDGLTGDGLSPGQGDRHERLHPHSNPFFIRSAASSVVRRGGTITLSPGFQLAGVATPIRSLVWRSAPKRVTSRRLPL